MVMARESVVEICEKYLQSLKDHDPSKVPFAPDVTITENGRVTAKGIEAAHKLHKADAMKVIQDIRVTKWVVDGDAAIALYELDRTDGRMVMISEYFRVYDGQIREVKANFGTRPTEEEVAQYLQQSQT